MTALDPDTPPTPDRRRTLTLAEPVEAELAPLGPDDAPAQWTGDPAESGGGGPSLDRYLAALSRFKWLIALFVALGGVLGVIGTQYITPSYVVQAIVSISPASRGGAGAMDLQAQRTNTLEMLTSFRVVDPVVTRLRLFVTPRTVGDSALFRDFSLAPSTYPGDYLLQLENGRYRLLLDETRLVESGALGDSIGRTVGFEWQPQASTLAGRSELAFTVRTPREVSVRLLESMEPRLLEGSSLLIMSLEHPSATLGALILNAWAESFVGVATEIQRAQVERRADILDGQLEFARNELSSAERALENYRVATATLPSESRIPQLAGMQLMQDPTFAAYTQQQVEVQNLQRDRTAITRALTAGADAGPSTEALLAIPTIAGDPAATELRQSLDEAFKRETRLRELRQDVTEEYPELIVERQALEQLRRENIPRSVRGIIAQLDQRLSTVSEELSAKELDLREVPQRTIELGRLTRKFEVEDARYRSLLQAAQSARLDEMTAPEDYTIYDRAVAPLKPRRNTAPFIVAGGIGAGLALGLLLALAIDLSDKRFRYPEQSTSDLGLFILGVVPMVRRGRRGRSEQEMQMVEAFRSIRMNLRYSFDPTRPIAFTVTSPGPTDGKSFVSANVALSFADAGQRVLLVDGDVRRGAQDATFGATASPGLVEYLEGDALLQESLRPTSHPNLTLLPCGRRSRRAPELLSGPRLTQLIELLRRDFDVVVVDSPPLGAGSDAYALGIATGHLAVVLRAGVTDRKLGAAKLRVVATLPIRVVGSILNGIQMGGMYKYYDYYLDYAARDAAPAELPAGTAVAEGSAR